ncbi:MAG: HEAT repeat domain-containing protein [Candidatus Delongbacteria bacterium]|nr:HEAT repeat domain-containing protein [Candidatus Delongbacteria bacterium]
MKDIKERIFDLVYDEIEDELQKRSILEAIGSDPELKNFYLELKEDADLIKEEDFISSESSFLESNRSQLFDKIKNIELVDEQDKSANNVFDFVKRAKFNIVLKYAAVVLLTFYATMYHFSGQKQQADQSSGYDNFNSSYNEDPNLQQVNYIEGSPFAETDRQLENYRVDNLEIDDKGEDIQIDFDISTSKTIKGKKNDPVIIKTLKYLIAHESNPGVKLRTLKAMDKSGTNKYEETLINTMLNDKDELIRRKAMKMISKSEMSKKSIDALYNVVLNDPDQVNRIEALSILEEKDAQYADKALTNMPNEDDEYLKYKTTLINK